MAGVELVRVDTGEIVEYDEDARFALDDELINHLGLPENAMILYGERFDADYLEEDESTAAAVLKETFDHIHQYDKAPKLEELQYRFKKVDFEVPRSDPRWLINQFKKRWVKNLAAEVVEDLADGIMLADPRPAIETATKDLMAIRERIRPQNTILTNTDYEWVLNSHFQRIEDQGGANGVPFGFPKIDQALLGLKKGMLVFVIARPKRYKTWMLIKSAVEAQKAGYKGVFYTLEMPLQEMYTRYACMVTEVGFSDFMRGTLTQKELDSVYDKMESTRDGYEPLKFLRPPAGERRVTDLRILAKEHGADCIYLDQLKFIESDLKVAADKRFAIIERICEELKEAAEEFPWYVACQFNREAANLTEMADLSKIGLSDAIGQTGDILLGLYQSKEMKQSNELQFGVIDARQFEPAVWTIQVELSMWSNFRCTGLVT